MRSLLVSVLLMVVIVVPSFADDIVRIAPPVSGPIPFIGQQPAVAATPDGFAVSWVDLEVLEPFDLAAHLRFARHDVNGARVADSGWLDFDISQIYPFVPRLLPVQGGFVSFFEDDATAVWSINVASDGAQLGPGREILTSGELYPFSVASSGGNVVLTYPEWRGTWTDWAVPIGNDGRPSGPRVNVVPAVSTQNLAYRFIVDSPLAPTRGGFVTTWFEGRIGIRVRELGPHGAAAGPVTTVVGNGCPGIDPAVATVGDVEAVVYAEGCDQTDLYMTTRSATGAFGPRRVLADGPVSEGSKTTFETLRPLRVAGGDRTIGVLYSLVVPLSGGGSTIDWVLAEFDLDGRLVGTRRQLKSDLGIVPAGDIDLEWDSYHGRFLLAWAGGLRDDRGVYVMAVPSGT
jgi:hypothetical protein